MVCERCRKATEGTSPDLIRIRREDNRATIGVDAIRYIRQDLYLSSNESDNKIYIIEEAHLMTPQAQNAFLKALEEPPFFVLFLLLSESGENLLDTVKSRAPTLYTERLRPDEIADYLLTHHKQAKKLKTTSPAAFDAVLTAAGGTIGNALNLLLSTRSKPAFTARTQADEILNKFFSRGSRSDFFVSFLSIVQKRKELSEVLSLIYLGLRDILVIKKFEDAELCFFTDRELLIEKTIQITTAVALRLSDATADAISALAKSANINTLMLNYANRCYKILTGRKA